MTLNVALPLALLAILGAVVYALMPSKPRVPRIERIPPEEKNSGRYVTLERLIEDHLDQVEEDAALRAIEARRRAKRERALSAVKKLAGDEAAAAASPN